MELTKTPLIEAEQIRARVRALAQEIEADYAGAPLVLLTVLKGSLHFASDLQRAMSECLELHLEFIRARSYDGTASTGTVELLYTPEVGFTGRHVLVLEDILDTGRTATSILAHVRAQQPATLRLATLLDKPARRVVPIEADYVGFRIDDHFVVGYGLDLNERYRHLPAIHCLV